MSKVIEFLKKPHMIRLMLNRCVKKCLVALVLVLLWGRFISQKAPIAILQDGCFVTGAFFFVMAWFSYLGLDGMRINMALFRKHKGEPLRRRGSDMIDYVEEDVAAMEELSDEERYTCGMLSSLVSGLLFFVPAIVASVV